MSSIRHQRGVTLMELMVVMVIIGILAAIAYPAYRKTVMRTNRTNAKTVLTQTAQTFERCFTRTNTYVGCVVLPFTTPEGNYQISEARSGYGHHLQPASSAAGHPGARLAVRHVHPQPDQCTRGNWNMGGDSSAVLGSLIAHEAGGRRLAHISN